ncbi:hypothetical protein THRCLA_07193 [Thraustotheca clavata]|uniref:RING-type E3 ubiquitin transferase n=1 Tax=Thraustotheca clavata TaxID=74557 RepID=A0A1V9ZFE6_9STRA|nr:hypothetical protein THRCLA_07193 [Thraustotheca clavata]
MALRRTDSKRALCTFYQQNQCTKGQNCRFEHTKRPCKYYGHGSCSMGENCRFEHSKSDIGSSEAMKSNNVTTSDSNRIVTGEINGVEFQVEILDPLTIANLARRDYDEETDLSYVEHEAPEAIEPRLESFQMQLDELEEKMVNLAKTNNQIDEDDDQESLVQSKAASEYSDIVPAVPPKQCKFHMQGACRFGNACVYSHAKGLSPDEGQLMEKELHASQDIECNICMDLVLRAGERFGLLPNCYHAFCLKCVREKGKDVLRECPVCKADAPFVVPCNRLVTDPLRKKKIIDDYKANMAQIPCRHFNLGRGKCPFGNKCFYEHRYPNGKLADRTNDSTIKPALGSRMQSS